ncbi:MAG: site-specific integrase [Candidatus Aminicenantales bacterium]
MKKEKNIVFIPARDGKPAHYLTEITLNWRRVRRFAGYTKGEAKTSLAKLRIAAREGKLGDLLKPARVVPGTSFGEYAKGLLDSAAWRQKRSHRRDETSLAALNKMFKNIPLAEIKPGAVRMYMTKRTKDDGRKPATANRELSLLKSVLYAAEFDDILPANPLRGRRVKRLEENNMREEHILGLGITDDQLRRLVDAGGDWFGVVLRLAVTLGMRLGEILKSEWQDFSLTLGTLRVRAENAKNKHERTIPLDAELAVAIDSLPRIGQYIFALPNGKRRQDVRKPFEAACKAADIPMSREKGVCFHDLRHFAASRLVRKTNVVTAMRILGWLRYDMIDRYVHPTDDDKRLAVDAVAAEIFPLAPRQNPVNAQNDRAGEAPVELPQVKRVQ